TDEDVDLVVVLPESPDLDPLQIAGPAKGIKDMLADDGVSLPALSPACCLLFRVRFGNAGSRCPTNATPRHRHPARRLPAGSGREKAYGGLAGCPLARGRPCSPGPWR